MMQNDRRQIEETILKIANDILFQWKGKFEEISIFFEISDIHRNDNIIKYFSEIEVNFYDSNGDFVTFMSIILFMDNKQALTIENAAVDINEQLNACYQECVSR